MIDIETVRDLLQEAGAGIVPRTADPVAAVTHRVGRIRAGRVVSRVSTVALVVAAAAAIVATETGPRTEHTSPTTEGRTQVVAFVPYIDGHVNPKLHVVRREFIGCPGKSSISIYSIFREPAGALVLFVTCAGGRTLPMCFSGLHQRLAAVCPIDPAAGTVALGNVLSLTGSVVPAAGGPWALQVGDGQLCTATPSTTTLAQGLGAPYRCASKEDPTSYDVCRSLNRSGEVWHVSCDTVGSPRRQQVAVKIAWT